MPTERPDHPPLLAARGLRFTRNETPVFGPLDFDVDAGEALLVEGGNGAGKTTLLRVLAGLLPPDGGSVAFDGRPANQVPEREWQSLTHDLRHWEISPAGTEGYRTAEVTLGGVDTAELSSKTMETRKVPGLYFIGEP